MASHCRLDPVIVGWHPRVDRGSSHTATGYDTPWYDSNHFGFAVGLDFDQRSTRVTLEDGTKNNDQSWWLYSYLTELQPTVSRELTLQADTPPVRGPVQTLVSCSGLDPMPRASIASLQALISTMGSSAFCRVSGICDTWLVEIDPQPDNVTSPSWIISICGRAIGWTTSLNTSGLDNFSRLMSYGPTPLEFRVNVVDNQSYMLSELLFAIICQQRKLNATVCGRW